MRPGWDTYFLDIAECVSRRATCPRASIGAVFVDARHRIVATGYNGSPPGRPHCTGTIGHDWWDDTNSLGSPCMVYLSNEDRLCGKSWKEHQEPIGCLIVDGHCARATHAESNAVAYGGRDLVGSTLYLHGYPPCHTCSKLVITAGVIRVVWRGEKDYLSEHPDDPGVLMLRQAGVKLERVI